MPNANYRKGADFERYVCRIYRHLGYFVVRSAGSHTPVDVVAIPCDDRGKDAPLPHLVQCKGNRVLPQAARMQLELLSQTHYVQPMLAYKMKGPFKGWTRCEEVV